MGAFSPYVLSSFDLQILQKVGSSKKRSKLTSWSLDPDARKYSLKSLGEAVSGLLQLGVNCDGFLVQAIESLLYGMLDYTINKRGDVGLFIRENSIISLQSILVSYVNYLEAQGKASIVTEQLIVKIIG